MKKLAKKLTKAKDGIFKKKTWTTTVAPDDSVISTRPGMRGSTVTVITDDKGKKIDRYRTSGLTRAQKKANEMYAKNPRAAKEDDFKPFTPGMKNGGAKKPTYKSGGAAAAKPKAMYGTSMKSGMMKKGGVKKK